MELGIILTYFGLIFTAYSATQEFQRIKLKLIPKWLIVLFFIFSIILFVTSFKEFKTYLLTYNQIVFVANYCKTHYPFIWQLKYFILLGIHIFIIIFSITFFTKLRYGNQKKFLNLLINLSKQGNYKILNELTNENILKIISLENKKTFLEEYKKIETNEFLDTLKTKQDFNFDETCIKKSIFYILKNFSYDKKFINEIENFIKLEPNIKTNELIGFEQLKILIKNNSFQDKFIEEYLKNLFQNKDSYIVKQVIDENNSNQYKSLLLYNSVDLELNNSIGLAIIEFLKDDKNIQEELSKKYDGANEKTSYIATLIDLFPKNRSYFTNTLISIKKELLKYSKLDENLETNGFYLYLELLKNIFEYIKIYYKDNQAILVNINSLYSLKDLEICDSKKIKIISIYLDFLLKDNINEEEKFKDFRNILNDKSYLKEFFKLAMENKDRTVGKEYLEYGIYEKKLKKWEQIKSLITQKN
ncbi:hypothetical protein L5F64_03105 [Aliarcobacter butzleri]|nr:hypothetical protein [Aliarcobacter butzleri]